MTTQITWREITAHLLSDQNLTSQQAVWAMNEVMEGNASPVQLTGFLVALRSKGETSEEVQILADSLLSKSISLEVSDLALDIVGTGGDGSNSVNISSMASIVAAAAGCLVVKHGNRSATSSSGSADVLEALGIQLDLSPQGVAQVADRSGITFCFAAKFHPSMRHAAAVRRELGVPTAFNLLGPLTNPARVRASAIGVPSAKYAEIIAGVLARRNASGLVFVGADYLDEMTVHGPSTVWQIRNGRISCEVIDPQIDLGFAPSRLEDLRGADVAHNAQVVRDLVNNKITGAIRDAVVLNAAAGIVAYRNAELASDFTSLGLRDALELAIGQADAAITSGSARATLDAWVVACNEASAL